MRPNSKVNHESEILFCTLQSLEIYWGTQRATKKWSVPNISMERLTQFKKKLGIQLWEVVKISNFYYKNHKPTFLNSLMYTSYFFNVTTWERQNLFFEKKMSLHKSQGLKHNTHSSLCPKIIGLIHLDTFINLMKPIARKVNTNQNIMWFNNLVNGKSIAT